MRTLNELCRLVRGATLTIYGPRVEEIDPAAVAGPRIIIGRAALAVPAAPGQTWWLPGDWARVDAGRFRAYLHQVTRGRAGVLGIVPNGPAPLGGANLVHYQPLPNSRDLERNRYDAALANCLVDTGRPLVTAAHLAWILGAEAVTFVTPGRDADDVPTAEWLFNNLASPVHEVSAQTAPDRSGPPASIDAPEETPESLAFAGEEGDSDDT